MVVDGQGGGIGGALIKGLREGLRNDIEVLALGTNSMATSRMMKAGANRGATGENAIVRTSAQVDIIENGLKSQEDFLCFEAMDLVSGLGGGRYKAEFGLGKPFDVDDSDWLRGYYKDGGMMVWYVGR